MDINGKEESNFCAFSQAKHGGYPCLSVQGDVHPYEPFVCHDGYIRVHTWLPG